MQTRAIHVAVVGGGISGLAAAYRCLEQGFTVTLVEAESYLGGLGSSFDYRGAYLERFYHCLLPNDDALLPLVEHLGLGSDVVWKTTEMGFMHKRTIYPLNTAKDLLNFAPLRMTDRLRLGVMGLRAPAMSRNPHLDEITAVEWVKKMIGARAFETLWKPLLEAKMGDGYVGIPALWLSSRMGREKNTKRETRGYLKGGYRALVEAIERSLAVHGARVLFKHPVRSIVRDGERMKLHFQNGTAETFDLVVVTAPLVEFQRITKGLGLESPVADLQIDYQGVLSGVFITKKPLSKYYWMPIVASGTTCQGIIEMSNLVPAERSHGLRVNYIVNYTHRTSALYQRRDDEILDAYEHDLATLYPEAARSLVDRFLFRAPFVEPLWTLGYARRRPPTSIIPGRLYLACTAQVYPRVNSWNSCCAVVDEMMPGLAAEASALPCASAVRKPA
jgi:protoporphyrinogen oxidase